MEGANGALVLPHWPHFSQSSEEAEPGLQTVSVSQLHVSGELVTSHLCPNQHLSSGGLGSHLWFCGLFACSVHFSGERPELSLTGLRTIGILGSPSSGTGRALRGLMCPVTSFSTWFGAPAQITRCAALPLTECLCVVGDVLSCHLRAPHSYLLVLPPSPARGEHWVTVLSCYLVLELTSAEAVAYQLFTAKFLFLSYSCGGGARGAALGQVCLFLLILLQVEGGVFLTPALVMLCH